MQPMPSKMTNNLIDELQDAKYKGLIDVSYTPTENNNTSVTVYFADEIKPQARINFARYLNQKYLLFHTKFRYDYDEYTFCFCPLFMTINEYFEERQKQNG